MTADHKILTDKGWMKCAETAGFNWAPVSLPQSYKSCRKYERWKGPMVMQMCMRRNKSNPSKTLDLKDKSRKILQLLETSSNWEGDIDTWNEQTPRIWCMALNETTLRKRKSSSLSKLWRTGEKCLQRVERELRKILGRYGHHISPRLRFRSHRQQQRLFTQQLQMDYTENQQQEQAYKQENTNTIRLYDNFSIIGNDRYWRYYNSVSNKPRLADRIIVSETGCEELVYDIINCGQRHRFTVWDSEAKR